MIINTNRIVLNICSACNLKCKHCLAFIPYYKKTHIMSYSEAKSILEHYFAVVDSVKHFTVTGGEPLLNKDVLPILEEVMKYKRHIGETLDFVTNATMMIPNEVQDFFEANKDSTRIVLSDYGPDLSKKLNSIQNDLDNRGIVYRISKFYGDNLYYNGWIDFSDHSLKWKTIEERDRNAAKCIHNVGKYFVINDGEIHRCSRSFWRIKNGYIPKLKGEYVPLMDDSISVEEKKKYLMMMVDSTSSTSCAHCVGLRNDVERVQPAQQLV